MKTFYAFGRKRRSETAYTYASRNERTGAVRFHKTKEAAKRAAGRWGYIAPASTDPAEMNARGWRA